MLYNIGKPPYPVIVPILEQMCGLHFSQSVMMVGQAACGTTVSSACTLTSRVVFGSCPCPGTAAKQPCPAASVPAHTEFAHSLGYGLHSLNDTKSQTSHTGELSRSRWSTFPMTLRKLIGSLTRMPFLEELRLPNTRYVSDGNDASCRVVTPDHLKILELKAGAEDTSALLYHLRVPRRTVLDIHVMGSYPHTPIHVELLTRLETLVTGAWQGAPIRRLDHHRTSFDRTEVAAYDQAGTPVVRIDCTVRPVQDVLRGLWLAHVQELNIVGEGHRNHRGLSARYLVEACGAVEILNLQSADACAAFLPFLDPQPATSTATASEARILAPANCVLLGSTSSTHERVSATSWSHVMKQRSAC
ncbi:hypothetical protein PUNSTDRAFT_43911 [Punctularia strigosozonata HHB-11173 SS5]|uniref:uncharacterized protein n=1 Tax=Punctularia strigosozonata (strain HHB-11173) TaxID=741275 RepID=UPI0004417C78|nr:uncharacterized protein PUNSTDRAFT_43911 [Punctularia strigosozonata HHB-11173 SS5]EIN09558.1 hypothetical protein PUNSTDRAFT_43911 [Punctularia strigosozonata HHB-11173 SS5]